MSHTVRATGCCPNRGRLGSWPRFVSVRRCPGLSADIRRRTESASHGHVRTSLNGRPPGWKAGWVYALTSSNLVSSAISIPSLTRAGITVSGVGDESEAPFVR